MPKHFPLAICCLFALLAVGLFKPGNCLADESCTTSQPGGYWVVSTYGLPQEPGACPSELCMNYYFRPGCGPLQKSTAAGMQQSLVQEIPTLIFVHGSFVDVDSALHDAHQTYRWLLQGSCGQPINVIFFVWPSSDAETILLPTMVLENGLKASQNGTYLAYLIDSLPAKSPLCLMGHSHGVRVIVSGLHFRAGGSIQGRLMNRQNCKPRSIRAVFAAAAINHKWMNPNNRYGLALTQVDCVLNLVNHRDVALALYPFVSPTYGLSLAKTGITPFDRNQLGPYADKIHDLNISPIVGIRHVWSNYYSRPELSRLISRYVYFSGGAYRPQCLVTAELAEDVQALRNASAVLSEKGTALSDTHSVALPLPALLESDDLLTLPPLPGTVER